MTTNDTFFQSKIEEYQEKFREHQGSPQSLKWTDRVSAEARYAQLVADIDFNGKTILDVGCGFGDISEFISSKAGNYTYVGIDMVPEFIEVAKQRYPEHTFIEGNYFLEPLPDMHDIVMCCGALNSNMDDPIGFRKQAIQTMWQHANEAVVFNMAGRHPRPNYSAKSSIYYADSLEILDFCTTLTTKVILRQHYSKKDFTIVLYK
ncbi:class I SAM-dependent methyltransferase [bacterium]|nr:class I SAM-dependent methyltransferase [bacterium]